ncbi:MAG TPA: four helix bundle protein [Nitrospirales bacterium]|nr:four helix bundle protein [Nitrospirales bacterium]
MITDETDKLLRRTKRFALAVIAFCRELDKSREARIIGDQLLRAGTSVAANYRAACRGRSRAEFIAKLGIVVEEADEVLFWCELLQESGTGAHDQIKTLMAEINELLSIFSASLRTARMRSKSRSL